MQPTKKPKKLKMRASWRLEYMVMISPFISAFLAYNKESQHDNNTVVSLLRDHPLIPGNGSLTRGWFFIRGTI